MSKSWEQRLAEANAKDVEEDKKRKEEEEARNSGRPQLLNLNEDGMLDRKIFFDLSKVTTASVGRKQEHHATFETSDKGTFLKPLSEPALEFIFINGKKITGMKPVQLKPNDRIIFGTGSCFLFRNDDKKKD